MSMTKKRECYFSATYSVDSSSQSTGTKTHLLMGNRRPNAIQIVIYLMPFFSSWLRTGDEVIINEDAEIFVIDRLKVRSFRHLLYTTLNDLTTGDHESPWFPSRARGVGGTLAKPLGSGGCMCCRSTE
jgi:hypothetical protein